MAIQTDSRLVKPGDTFVAVKGAATDGARFVPAASNLLLRDDAGVPVVAAAPATTFFILR